MASCCQRHSGERGRQAGVFKQWFPGTAHAGEIQTVEQSQAMTSIAHGYLESTSLQA